MKIPKIPSTKDIRNSEIMKSFKKLIGGNAFTTVVAKLAVTICFWVIALVPMWIYLLIRMVAGPDNFWQELAIVVVCMVIMGWAQVLLAIVAAFITVAIIIDDTI